MGPRDPRGSPQPPPPPPYTRCSGTMTPEGTVVLVDAMRVPPLVVPLPHADQEHVRVRLADGSCYCSARGDGDSWSSDPCSVCSSCSSSDGSGSGSRSPIGNISLSHSTAQIGSVMNYITVLVPDKAAAAKAAEPGGDRDLRGIAIKAAAVAAKEKLNYLGSTEGDKLPSSLTASQTLVLRRYLRWPCVALPIALLAALATILVVYFAVLNQYQSVDDVSEAEAEAGVITLPNGVKLATREVWHAQPSVKPMPVLFTPVKYVVVHHTATDTCMYLEYCASMVRAFQQYHQSPVPQGRGWDDVGYNYLVGGDGIVYEGRGWDSVGGHFEFTEWGNKTMNIALIGLFAEKLPPAFQREELRKFIEWGVSMGKIRRDYQLLGACQIKDTLSPGLRFMDDLRTWRNWWDFLEKPEYCKE